LVAVYASPETRFRRLFRRGRSDAPTDWAAFRERDMREIGVGVAAAMALADYMLVNERSMEQFKEEAEKLLRKLVRDE